MRIGTLVALGLAVFCGVLTGAVWTEGDRAKGEGMLVAPGLVLPRMNPQNGKLLFASKGCVVCHQVNGIGGTDAASLDVKTMAPVMSPFDFFASMWLGAEPMINMQKNELGGQIELTGQDLADIVAFVHNRATQQTFSEKDIPENIKKLMQKDESSGSGSMMDGGDTMGGSGMGGGMMKNGQ